MITKILPRISIVLYAENVFMLVWVFFWLIRGGATRTKKSG